MDDREKIKAALEQGSKAFSAYFRSELRKALDGGKGHFGTKDTEKTVIDFIADALIAANIGDVTEWREKVECAKRILQIPTLPNGTTDLSYFEYKGERIQDIARQRDEYKHRAEVLERALIIMAEKVLEYAQKAKVTAMTSDGLFSCEKDVQLALLANDALIKAEQKMTEEEK